MKKVFLLIFGCVLMLSLANAVTISTFNNSLSSENLTFSGNQNTTRYLNLSSTLSNVTLNAKLNLTGLLVYDCYQESANTSNQSGNDGTCGLNYSGVYNTSENNYLYINYSKPTNNITGALWRVKHGAADEYNVSIPNSCFSYNQQFLMLRLYSDLAGTGAASLNNGSFGQCYDGTWNTITTVYNGSTNTQAIGGSNVVTNLYDGNWDNYATHYSVLHVWRTTSPVSTESIYEEGIFWGKYPINPFISINGTTIWNFTGVFNQSNNQSANFSAVLNAYLGNCTYSNGICNVPFLFASNTSGILQYSAINITWNDTTSPLINITEPTGQKSATQINYTLNASDNWLLDKCLYWITRGASLEVANTTLTCSNNITGSAYVSSVGTNYTFHFWINDTSGNSNYTTSNFSTSSGAVIVTPPATSGGGGGGSIIEDIRDLLSKNETEYGKVCETLYPALKNSWNIFTNQPNIENFKALWFSYWDYITCKGSASITPLSILVLRGRNWPLFPALE